MRLLAGLLLAAVVSASCGGNSGAGASCAEVQEDVDPLSIQHVLGAGTVTYLTDPPTSGPHASGPAVQGLFEEPLSKAAQVRLLEVGGVVVQYNDEITDLEVRTLLATNDVRVAIAPGVDLPSPVVATAWTWKLSCTGVDLEAIQTFMAQRPVAAPGED